MGVLSDTSRIVPRPEITIIRSAADFFVEKWNVPAFRKSKFFYCYCNCTPNAAEVTANGRSYMLGPEHCLIIPPDLLHELKQYAPFRHMFFHFIAGSPYTKINDVVSIPAEPFLKYLKIAGESLKVNLALYSLLFNRCHLSGQFKKTIRHGTGTNETLSDKRKICVLRKII